MWKEQINQADLTACTFPVFSAIYNGILSLKHGMRVFNAQVDQTIRKPMGVRSDTEHEAYDQNQMYPTYHQFALYISDQRIYFIDL